MFSVEREVKKRKPEILIFLFCHGILRKLENLPTSWKRKLEKKRQDFLMKRFYSRIPTSQIWERNRKSISFYIPKGCNNQKDGGRKTISEKTKETKKTKSILFRNNKEKYL